MTITCSICKLHEGEVSFSKSQLKHGHHNQPATCKTCVAKRVLAEKHGADHVHKNAHKIKPHHFCEESTQEVRAAEVVHNASSKAAAAAAAAAGAGGNADDAEKWQREYDEAVARYSKEFKPADDERLAEINEAVSKLKSIETSLGTCIPIYRGVGMRSVLWHTKNGNTVFIAQDGGERSFVYMWQGAQIPASAILAASGSPFSSCCVGIPDNKKGKVVPVDNMLCKETIAARTWEQSDFIYGDCSTNRWIRSGHVAAVFDEQSSLPGELEGVPDHRTWTGAGGENAARGLEVEIASLEGQPDFDTFMDHFSSMPAAAAE